MLNVSEPSHHPVATRHVLPSHHARSSQARPSMRHVSAASSRGQPPSDNQIMQKIKAVEKELSEKERTAAILVAKGHLNVNGPLPVDFSDRFAQGVAEATGCREADVQLLGAVHVTSAAGSLEEIMFRSRSDVVSAVEDQAANPDSKLANGILHSFLVARDDPEEDDDDSAEADAEPQPKSEAAAPEVDMAMPYGDLEPFGREDTAQELTESSIRESNAMVDQLEKAEVAEEKRAVFRALTRLRGAAITSYDGIARSQTGNVDSYARDHQWRTDHPVHHLADDEADTAKWAFPDGDSD